MCLEYLLSELFGSLQITRQMAELRLHHQQEMGTLQQEKNQLITEKDEMMVEKDRAIIEKDRMITERDDVIRAKNYLIQEQENELQHRPWILQRDEVEVTDERIGGGAYGEVKIAVFRGTRVAAKLLHNIIVSRHNKSIFTREMEISSRVHHPNIVQFLGATRIDNPILLYELMTTSLHDRLQDDRSLTRPQIISIGSDISSALAYLHNWRPHPIIHRDVSSPNVLMEPLSNEKWRCKLSDLGSANIQLHVKTEFPGNMAYSAPEANNPSLHTPRMDIYSLGVLMTEVTLHQAPEMTTERRQQQANRIDWVPMKRIALNCINTDHNKRVTALQLLKELSKL